MAWSEGPVIGPAGATGILEAADYAFAALARFGIRVKPGSRFALARAAVAGATGDKPLPPQETLAEATRSIYELYWIMRSLGGTAALSADMQRELTDVLSGSQLPQDESAATSRPRNLQFQFFVGAWLSAGGIRVFSSEPDLVIDYFGRPAGVAAKRIFSRAKFMDNVRNAVDQIEKSGLPGMVALNVDRLIDDLDLAPSSDITAHFDARVPELARAREYVIDNEAVVGLLTLGMHVAWEESQPRPRVIMSHLCSWPLIPRGSQTPKDINDFHTRFAAVHDARTSRL